jgi:hypothetical protein
MNRLKIYNFLRFVPKNIRKLVIPLLVLAFLLGLFVVMTEFDPVVRSQGGEWLSGWEYRKSHVIDAASEAGTNYQVKIKVHYSDGTDSGEDVFIGASEYSNLYYKISVASQIHDDYGLTYPVTYIFNIPSDAPNLKAYKRSADSENWTQLAEVNSNDFFNGIECVRFDYASNKAYVSVAFSQDSDEIHIKIIDQNDSTIPISFSGVAKYYDNRRAVVVASGDDWEGNPVNHAAYMAACDAFQSRKVWLTAGIITQSYQGGPPPNWTDIQAQLNDGYIEVASHSRTHPHLPYSDYDSEIEGSKNDIISNLNLPSLYRKSDKQYVWAWIEPYGEVDANVRQKLGQYKYLIDRTTGNNENDFANWDNENNLFQSYGTTTSADWYSNPSELNELFDSVYAAGKIYHFYFHPKWYDWSSTNIITEHLDYIKDKTDVWYVGLGALYQYHFISVLLETEMLKVEPMSKCRFDFGDIRFTRDDGVTLLDYWMESKVNGDWAVFWVEVPDDLSEEPVMIYIYYGNPDATSISNGTNTFPFFDDFEDDIYTDKWFVLGGTWIESGGLLTQSASGYRALKSKTETLTNNLAVESKVKTSGNEAFAIGAKSASSTSSGRDNVVYAEAHGFYNRLRTEFYDGTTMYSSAVSVNVDNDVFYILKLTIIGDTATSYFLDLNRNQLATVSYTCHVSTLGEKIQLQSYSSAAWDWIFVRKYVSPEPSHGAWGNEESATSKNNVPTMGQFQAPSIVYANKYFLLNTTINDPDGVTDIAGATIEIGSVILKWESSADALIKLSDPNNYCILDSDGSFKKQLNATAYILIWKIKLNWTYPEGRVSIIPANTKVFDNHGASSSGNQTELFTFEDDLIVHWASVIDSRINPMQTITIAGTLCYEGTTIPPEDVSGIAAKVNFGSRLIGSTAVIGTDGTFTISFAGEQNVGQYSYTVYATTDENTVQNKTVNVIVDKIKVQSFNVNDTRVNVNDNVNIAVLLNYEYDSLPVVDGSVTINGFLAVHQGGGFWRITQVKSTVQAVTYNTVAVSGNIYGITEVDQNGKSVTVIWDRIKVANLTANDNRTDVGGYVKLAVQLIYEYDSAPVTSGNFKLNGLPLIYQNGIWITIDTKNSTSVFTYDKVKGADEDYGITVINMNEQSATVIWDKVLIILSISDERIDVGATADVTFTGIYEFDSTSFTGTITLNNTTTKNTVGKYGYKVSSIFDPLYGLTAFTTNEVYCIFDRINITKFEALDNRINVGDTASFIVEGVYEYDSMAWIGSYELNDTATKTIIGKYWYKIVKITDSNYGLTVFQQTVPNACVIFDRINVVSYGSDDARRDTNTEATFYLILEYEYDGTLVTDGIAYFNGSLPLAWSNTNSRWEYKATKDSVQILTAYLAGVTGNSYGITALNPSISSKTITVIWDQIKITDGGVTKETLTLDETVIVWFRAIYEYDGTPFTGNNGTLYLNGTQMTWSSTNARWEYIYTADTVGTVTFKISAVLDSSQNLTTINDAVGAKTITIWSMPFSIISNSIITELYFNSSSKIITFKISGQDGTTGYINIAKTLIEDISELKIYLDDEPINYTLSYTNNFWLIHFTYHHSTHKVVIHLGSTFATKTIETYANQLTAYDIGIVTFVIFTAMILGKKKLNRKSAKTI